MEEKSKFLIKYAAIISRTISLKELTSFNIGGSAALYIRPRTVHELKAALQFVHIEHIPTVILGGGSNVLIADEGVHGAVVHTVALKGIAIEVEGGMPLVRVQTGVLMEELTGFYAAHSLTGLEDFAGLPGTVGGAAFMNARCYGTAVSDVLVSASALVCTEAGVIERQYRMQAEDWAYKRSPFQPIAGQYATLCEGRPIVTELTFKAATGNRAAIEGRMQERIIDRTNKGHFKLPSAGSVFKNNHLFGKPSGQLIDEAGLRGLQIGGAQVAPWHGNLIVNTGSATAKEVHTLIETIQQRVKDQTGFLLEPEVVVV
ncbi:MAG: UDP-N-acetylmuramate dehydrogenase [Treponema sp.]